MSIWGAVQSSEQIFRGCRFVSTSSHGGIILTANTLQKSQLLEKLRTFPSIESHYQNGNYYFEEDCEAAMVLYLLSDETLEQLFPKKSADESRISCLKTFVQYNPDYFTHVTGKGLSIFDSRVLMERLVQSNPDHYILRTAYSETSYNVPAGYVHFVVENGLGNSIGLLSQKDEYVAIRKLSYLPITVDQYQRFNMDTHLPMSKPRNRPENAFMVAQSRREEGSQDIQIVKAFNYQSNEYKYFRMTSAFETSLQQKSDSRIWIKYTDSSYSQLADDLDLFIQEVTMIEYENAVQFMRLNKIA